MAWKQSFCSSGFVLWFCATDLCSADLDSLAHMRHRPIYRLNKSTEVTAAAISRAAADGDLFPLLGLFICCYLSCFLGFGAPCVLAIPPSLRPRRAQAKEEEAETL